MAAARAPHPIRGLSRAPAWPYLYKQTYLNKLVNALLLYKFFLNKLFSTILLYMFMLNKVFTCRMGVHKQSGRFCPLLLLAISPPCLRAPTPPNLTRTMPRGRPS